MTATIDLTEAQILTALGDFLTDILPAGCEVIVGQLNGVPETQAPDFVIMTPTRRVRMTTNVDSWDLINPDPTTLTREQDTQVTVQLDVHGPTSADNSQRISTLFRDNYACAFFAASGRAVQPLYADDPQQLPFINEGNLFENRWVIQAQLQANPVLSTSQQFADNLAVGLIEVETTYPP